MKTTIKILSIAIILAIINSCVPTGGGVTPNQNLKGKINMINPYSPSVRYDLSKYIYDESGALLKIEYEVDKKVIRTANILNLDSVLIIDTDGCLPGQASPDATYHIEIRTVPNTNYISSIISTKDYTAQGGGNTYRNTFVNYSSLGKISSISHQSSYYGESFNLSNFVYNGNRLISYNTYKSLIYDSTASFMTEILYDSVYLRKKCTPQNVNIHNDISTFEFYGNFFYNGIDELIFGIQDPFMVHGFNNYVKNAYTNYEWVSQGGQGIFYVRNYTNNLVSIDWVGIIYNY